MTITILAIVFLAAIVVIAFGGSRLLGKSTFKPEEMNFEKCAICKQKFDKQEMVLREIGDYKLLYFCRECVLKLYSDLGMRN